MREAEIEWRNYGVPMVVQPRRLAPPSLPGLLAVAAIGSLVGMLLLCCLLSMRIGTERQRVAALDAAIVARQHDVAMLRKQIAISSRYQELDRWNATLGLSAPRAAQYLPGDAALAAYSPRQPRLALTGAMLPSI